MDCIKFSPLPFGDVILRLCGRTKAYVNRAGMPMRAFASKLSLIDIGEPAPQVAQGFRE
jgi:hypothetical protein